MWEFKGKTMLSRDIKYILKKDPNQTSRYETYNVWDEKYTTYNVLRADWTLQKKILANLKVKQ